MQAVRDAPKGISYVTQIAMAMEENYIRDPKSRDCPRHLSGRQREVLQMLAEGWSAKEIAYTLQVSVRTVHFHKYSIMEQLGIKTNSELVQYAIKHALIPPP